MPLPRAAVRETSDLVLAGGFAPRGQVVAITAGAQTNEAGRTNLINADAPC
jgi:hypothetical protein